MREAGVTMKRNLLKREIEEMDKELKREVEASDGMGTLNTTRPCGACRVIRRRCGPECLFCPYFSPHDPERFVSVHKVFGASKVAKLLMEAPESQRANAADSLVYEANVRIRDPVYGCLGMELKRLADDSDQTEWRNFLALGPSETLKTNRPCGACKVLRRRCAPECLFCPYFPPHDRQRFSSVRKVFGASNVIKLLMEAPKSQRADAADSLVYEANVRIKNPVYGCMGVVSSLRQQVQAVQAELDAVRAELLKYKSSETGDDVSTSSHLAFLCSETVSVASPAPFLMRPLGDASSSPMDNQRWSTTDGSCISNEYM